MTKKVLISKKDLIEIRPFRESDTNFILSTWLQGLYHGNDWFQEIDRESYFHHYQQIIKAILAKPDTEIRMACLKSDPDVTLGYSLSEGAALHYIFVKPVWRGIGLMKDLLPPHFHTTTHLTKVGLAILKKKFPSVIFNPFFKGVTHVR